MAKVRRNYDSWGFIDKNGTEVIPVKYDETADTFSEGLVWVRKDLKFGFVDKKGKLIVPLKYDYTIGGFPDGLAMVIKGEYVGYINKRVRKLFLCNMIRLVFLSMVWP